MSTGAAPLPKAVEIAIVGGGIAGIATAYYLARRGLPVLVFEKGRIAGEQSSRNWGWLRVQGRDPREIPAAMESLRLWRGISQEIGRDIGFHQGGIAYLGETEADMAHYEDWCALARDHGLDTRVLGASETCALIGDPVGRGRIIGALYTPSDARAEPELAVPALAEAAEKIGVRIERNCAVRAVTTAAGRVTGVITEKGPLACQAVVLAAGAWSALLCRGLGISLPQLSVRATVARTERAKLVTQSGVWGARVSFRRHRDGGYNIAASGNHRFDIGWNHVRHIAAFRKLMRQSVNLQSSYGLARHPVSLLHGNGRIDPEKPSPFEACRVLDPAPDPGALRQMQRAFTELYPAFENLKLVKTWAGMIDVLPDAIPAIGPYPGCPGLYLLTGLSGHGFGFGLGAGALLAQSIAEGRAKLDLSAFRPERFEEGAPIEPYTSL